jgi:large subunit ribosomal protein L23
MQNPYEVVYSVLITEKATALADDSKSLPKYTFKVNPKANKIEIRQAVEAIFDGVKVSKVNTMNYDGKRKRMRTSVGRRPNWKKAVVTLKQGKIDTL